MAIIDKEYEHGSLTPEIPVRAGYISQIVLPDGKKYEIHDDKAIHSANDLGLSAALRFVGVVDTIEDLPPTYQAKPGDVYLVTKDECEYVVIEYLDEQDNPRRKWEPLGAPHDFVGTKDFETHTHSFTQPTVTLPSIASTGQIPTYTATQTKLAASVGDITISEGSNKTSVLAGTASTKISTITDITPVSSQTTAGTSATWSAVVADGVLTFGWTTNTPTEVPTDLIVNVTVETDDIEVKFDNDQRVDITTSWNATTPKVTLTSGANGDVTVASGITTNGVANVTVKSQENIAANVVNGAVGAVTKA